MIQQIQNKGLITSVLTLPLFGKVGRHKALEGQKVARDRCKDGSDDNFTSNGRTPKDTVLLKLKLKDPNG